MLRNHLPAWVRRVLLLAGDERLEPIRILSPPFPLAHLFSRESILPNVAPLDKGCGCS
jgi:hypothetical protein